MGLMTITVKLLHYLLGLLLLSAVSVFAHTLPLEVALPIGIKIWFNECSGTINGLTSWNRGENFASLGIGHFIWYPKDCPKNVAISSSFPALLRYLKARHQKIPKLLADYFNMEGIMYAPWKDRAAFLAAQNSPLMLELRHFLSETIALQAEFIADQFMKIEAKMVNKIPVKERSQFKRNLQALSSNVSGLYALIDYLNFKGSGLNSHLEHGSGLTQVIYGMKYAPQTLSVFEAYVWSAQRALARRVLNTNQTLGSERWLHGWYKRLDTYLAGDPIHAQVV